MIVYVTTTEKEGHGFERKQESIYRRVRREEMEGENHVIILQKQENNL